MPPFNNYRHSFLLAILGFIVCLILIMMVAATGGGGRMAFDETNFHIPTIAHFAAGGSSSDYLSATTPGYHLILAAFARYISSELTMLRFAGALITTIFIFALGAIWAKATQPVGAWLALPALGSLYVIPAGIWLLPDNLAWLTVLGVLWLSTLSQWKWQHILGISLLCVATVLIRQSNVWVVAPTLATIIVGAGRQWTVSRRVVVGAITILPAIIILSYFVLLWGGLTPPTFQERHKGISAIAPAWFLVLFASNAIFYLPLIRHDLMLIMQTRKAQLAMVAGGLIGLVLSIYTTSTYDFDAGRYSGFWNFVRITPVLFGRSIFVVVGAVVGGALIALWLYRIDKALRLILLVSICGFSITQMFNHLVYDRYYIGFVLMLLAFMGLLSSPSHTTRSDKWCLLSAVILFGINAAALISKLAVAS